VKLRIQERPRWGDTEAVNLLGEVYSPEGGLVLGSKQQSMGPDPSFQCDLETQLSWAPETTAKKMAPACVAPEPLVPPRARIDRGVSGGA